MFRTITKAAWKALIGFLILSATNANAGPIVVSGDGSLTYALIPHVGTPAIDPGNQQFFSNVLGSGTSVIVQGTDSAGFTPVANINTFYNTLGVSSNIQSGLVTSASLAGINLFVSAFPASPFSASEILALSGFSAAGGTLFLLGEHGGIAATQDANLNALLIGLGSSLRIVPETLDAAFVTTSGSHILANPLTAGVATFTYAATARVSGGIPLFTVLGGQTFIAEEGIATAISEPGTMALFGAGLSLLGMLRRRKSKK